MIKETMMTMSRFSDDPKLHTLLSRISQQPSVSGADATELLKILKDMGPRPSVDELVDIVHSTPGSSRAQVCRIAVHVLECLAEHLIKNLSDHHSEKWAEEMQAWRKEYCNEH
jgi:hypothetical protein